MSILTWSEDYQTGIQQIDEQHRELIDAINALHSMLYTAQTPDELVKPFSELLQCVQRHCDTEEDLMCTYAYPDYIEQRIEHEQFLERLVNLFLHYHDTPTQFALKLMPFLKRWMHHHLQGADKVCGEFLHNHGVS